MALHKYLSVFNNIIKQGEKHNGKYYSHGLSAWHDFDGYTCYLGYQGLTMTLYFHNRYTYDTPDRETLIEFEAFIDNLVQTKAFK